MGPAIGRGVLGHAVSRDLEHRSLRTPLFRSKVFGQLEVPQVFEPIIREANGSWSRKKTFQSAMQRIALFLPHRGDL
ncbi:hypothetical protein [Paraburkholderia sp. LEh10]|uniref:hypothetical protein n=1 Tax=Paraburkholderia sp. LEh10 TaxID=2821353 RepID=UPI000764EADA|nr:hypothetical protein [Paraburkholderia sp. LEh10]